MFDPILSQNIQRWEYEGGRILRQRGDRSLEIIGNPGVRQELRPVVGTELYSWRPRESGVYPTRTRDGPISASQLNQRITENH